MNPESAESPLSPFADDEAGALWEAQLLELLSEVDTRIHRVMARFIEAGGRAKSDIATMIDDALRARSSDDDTLARELADVRAEIESVRSPAVRRPAADAMALVDGVWSQTQAELAPIRKTVDHLHSIESTVGKMLSPHERHGGTLHLRVTLLGMNSYQQAISLAHGIKDDLEIRDVSIQSYQPGRLLLMVTGTDEASIARRILLASDVSIERMPDQADSIVFQTTA